MRNHEGQGYVGNTFLIREAHSISLEPRQILLRHFYQIYCHWDIFILTASLYSSLTSDLLFLPQDPSIANFYDGWFGHFHIYFKLLLIQMISSC